MLYTPGEQPGLGTLNLIEPEAEQMIHCHRILAVSSLSVVGGWRMGWGHVLEPGDHGSHPS